MDLNINLCIVQVQALEFLIKKTNDFLDKMPIFCWNGKVLP